MTFEPFLAPFDPFLTGCEPFLTLFCGRSPDPEPTPGGRRGSAPTPLQHATPPLNTILFIVDAAARHHRWVMGVCGDGGNFIVLQGVSPPTTAAQQEAFSLGGWAVGPVFPEGAKKTRKIVFYFFIDVKQVRTHFRHFLYFSDFLFVFFWLRPRIHRSHTNAHQ